MLFFVESYSVDPETLASDHGWN